MTCLFFFDSVQNTFYVTRHVINLLYNIALGKCYKLKQNTRENLHLGDKCSLTELKETDRFEPTTDSKNK